MELEAFSLTKSQLLIAPRKGLYTPWGTKVKDIFKRCGIQVERVEPVFLLELSSDSQTADFSSNDKKKLYDPMTQSCLETTKELATWLEDNSAKSLELVPLLKFGISYLQDYSHSKGLALSESEMQYVLNFYRSLGRSPTDVELMMFSQVNSEHCRHKIFKTKWFDGQDGRALPSMFELIQKTHAQNPQKTLLAYTDNAAIIQGGESQFWHSGTSDNLYSLEKQNTHWTLKAETHNHPTMIAPFPGAATGVGGEIRDEVAVGLGAMSLVGFSGYITAHLNLDPHNNEKWENGLEAIPRNSSPLEIMLQAPLGASFYANEYGRPHIAGFFRTFESLKQDQLLSFCKPVMLAGGIGQILEENCFKKKFTAGSLLVVLGGEGMKIGLGGGSVSSASEASEEVDYSSVQRDNPEMQRRAYEVVRRCFLRQENPILSIHDVGAGGLSNAIPELVNDVGLGAKVYLDAIPVAEQGMSPLELWCNESQERYVLAIDPKDKDTFEVICTEENCPYGIIGEATDVQYLQLIDKNGNLCIDLPLDFLFEGVDQLQQTLIPTTQETKQQSNLSIDFNEAAHEVMRFPSVSAKHFLITIADRSLGGRTLGDQMVGSRQVPVADVAIVMQDFVGKKALALGMGEKPQLAESNPQSSLRMACAEALCNLSAAQVDVDAIKLSANWMANAKTPEEQTKLYVAVQALSEFCCQLGISIPVGKDSLSMKTQALKDSQSLEVAAPITGVISAVAEMQDGLKSLNPELQDAEGGSLLFLLDCSGGQDRLMGSALAQIYPEITGDVPDIEAFKLKSFLHTIHELHHQDWFLAYHDRSDGGAFACLVEMAFCSQASLELRTPEGREDIAFWFNEEIGTIVQISKNHQKDFLDICAKNGLGEEVVCLGRVDFEQAQISICTNFGQDFQASLEDLREDWLATTSRITSLRDDAHEAVSAHHIYKSGRELVVSSYPEDWQKKIGFVNTPKIPPQALSTSPLVVVLREQGSNGQSEMAYAFHLAGFRVMDLSMRQLALEPHLLKQAQGLACVGGFSFGDVLGGGFGWAASILHNPPLLEAFSQFFARGDSFSLGVCNGCQMLARLKGIIPGAEHFPIFQHNLSKRYESRWVNLEVLKSPSLFFQDMTNWRLPVPVAHALGRVDALEDEDSVCLQFVDTYSKIATSYPLNPNGSVSSVAGLTSRDGRVTIMMPHPERAVLTKQNNWLHPRQRRHLVEQNAYCFPWLSIFYNAYKCYNSS